MEAPATPHFSSSLSEESPELRTWLLLGNASEKNQRGASQWRDLQVDGRKVYINNDESARGREERSGKGGEGHPCVRLEDEDEAARTT